MRLLEESEGSVRKQLSLSLNKVATHAQSGGWEASHCRNVSSRLKVGKDEISHGQESDHRHLAQQECVSTTRTRLFSEKQRFTYVLSY